MSKRRIKTPKKVGDIPLEVIKKAVSKSPPTIVKPEPLLSNGVMWLIGFMFFVMLALGSAVFFIRPWERE